MYDIRCLTNVSLISEKCKSLAKDGDENKVKTKNEAKATFAHTILDNMKELSFSTIDIQLTQKLFVEKAIELLYRYTVDTYRVRFSNPYTILEELCEVIDEFENGKIHNSKTVIALLEEVNRHIVTDDKLKTLRFLELDHEYFSKKILQNVINKGDKVSLEQCALIKRIARSIINANKNYLTHVIDLIKGQLVIDQTLQKETGAGGV